MGLLVVATTGFIDAYTFLRHGHVFAEAMTGNLVLVAAGAVQPTIVAFWRPLSAFAAFVVGVSVAAKTMSNTTMRRRLLTGPRVATLAFEIVVLAVIGGLPASAPQWAVVIAIAFASGLQIAAFRRIDGTRVTATVMTTNSARTIEAIIQAVESRRPDDVGTAATLLASVSLFVAGAFAGALASSWIGDPAAWIAAGLLTVAAVLNLLGGDLRSRPAALSEPGNR